MLNLIVCTYINRMIISLFFFFGGPESQILTYWFVSREPESLGLMFTYRMRHFKYGYLNFFILEFSAFYELPPLAAEELCSFEGISYFFRIWAFHLRVVGVGWEWFFLHPAYIHLRLRESN